MKLFVLLARDNPFTTTWELPPFLNTQWSLMSRLSRWIPNLVCKSSVFWVVVSPLVSVPPQRP
ncbi:hypothetical protein RO3G_13960 [Rhizopus delemar RA 99-880]|uniref:Uncharacterized protein n=1 Tax=Rhizopus delemar (strain RA 99-880 / ATCC MYA-4621 / FGSC 9543 / NRRL 43880) TaxID=246409 RepID=I1CLB9_RHIO9|nr:hypothetical protein RO3G_13960 [Rhizopus delemar RA 99-880]|eukprot:EIE89249.1 hypothetical protein RO3G_13960 [Rhizopus delemar RA 99-880]